MKRWVYACLVIGLVLLAAPVAGQIPDAVAVSTDTEWLTAGSGETAAITVNVTNGTPAAGVGGVRVELSVNGTDWSITPAEVVTGADGKATARFSPGTKSGTARITATVLGLDEPLNDSVEQRIDHAAPYRLAGLWYDPEVNVSETTDIVLRMEDRYGNPVDSRRVAENVTFMVGSPAGGAKFVGSGSDNATVGVDGTGNATARLRVDTVAGENIVYIQPPASAGSGRYITITAAGGEPAGIYQTVSPDAEPLHYPELPLGGEFTITYALYDGYGNPAGDRKIKVDIRPISGSLLAGDLVVKTNSQGKAQIIYRSLDRAGVAEIVATAVDNNSVSCTKKVGFYSSTPVEMLITAVPGTIASRDVKEDIVSVIRAKVIDSKGNGVRNETVSFKITDVNNTFPMSRVPEISNGTLNSTKDGTPIVATTDEEGIATINFHPGAFTKDHDMATGNVTIQATWRGNNADTTVEFRNYPYLSINVTVDPEVVKVNDSVTVTIQLIGDGYALQKRPIDVVLCTDRSGSMLQNTTTNPNYNRSNYEWVQQESVDDRMVHAMQAAKVFVSQMESSKDRIGPVSFGQSGETDLDDYIYKFWAGNDYNWTSSEWVDDSSDDTDYITAHYKNPQTYSASATRDLVLTYTYTNVNTTIEKWLPSGGTPMREGLYQAVQMIVENSRGKGDPVKAIVLLTDGEWNTGGNPEGGWGAEWLSNVRTGSVIDYAKNKGIKIFTIALGNEPNHDELSSYANKTGGKFYSATAGDNLTQVYEDIATKLQEAAGVNTTMNLVFGTVKVNSIPTSDVFEYEYLNPVSTRMIKYWTDNKTTIWGPVCENQGTDWQGDGDKILSFDVGDIYLDQTWETTFRLRVLKEGNIDIFGNGSVIRFNGTEGKSEVGLPHTFITARLNLTETDMSAAQIWLEWKSVDIPEDKPGVLIPSWDLSYTGNRSVTQKILYQFSPDDIFWSGWHEADTKHHPAGTNINGTYSSSIPLQENGGYYKVRVRAEENIPDGSSAQITSETLKVDKRDVAYIKIE